MGATASEISYTSPIPDTETESSTSIFRAKTALESFTYTFEGSDIKNCWQLFERGVSISGSHPCLGSRVVLNENENDGSRGQYTWIDYLHVRQAARLLGSGILNLDLAPASSFPQEPSYKSFQFLGIFAKNCTEWILCEQAANAYGLTLVPLYDTLGKEAVLHILKQTRIKCIAVSLECGNILLDILSEQLPGDQAPYYEVSSLIVLDANYDEVLTRAKPLNIQVYSFFAVQEAGHAIKDIVDVPSSAVNTICFTSGSTGIPKGVLLTHGNFVSCVASALEGAFGAKSVKLDQDDIYLSFLPMAHVFERIVDNVLLSCGARIGFYQGNVLKLAEDMAELQPTILVMVPRLLNRIDEKIKQGVATKSFIAQFLFETGLKSKLRKIRGTGDVNHWFWDLLVFSKTRALSGGRCRLILSGGAPLDTGVHERMEALLCVPILEGYGMTETVGGAFSQAGGDASVGDIGGPMNSLEFRLDSIPEMNYWPRPTAPTTLNPDCLPIGELCVRGPSVSPGYFSDPDSQAEMYDADGWLHTGDVCILQSNGALRIVDRKKNLFKLSQGEYVSPEKLENIYSQSHLVSQIFIHGDSTKSFLLALIVPEENAAQAWAAGIQDHKSKDLKELCDLEAFREHVMQSLKTHETVLKGFEKVKSIHLIHEPFSVENGLLTPTLKLKRPLIREQYSTVLKKLYSE